MYGGGGRGVTSDKYVRMTRQRKVQELVVIRVATELAGADGSRDLYPDRHGPEIMQQQLASFDGEVAIELGTPKARPQLLERRVRKQNLSLYKDSTDDKCRRGLGR